MSSKKIKNLKHQMTNINVVVQVTDKGIIKIIETKFGKKTVCECVVKDNTGEARLLLMKEDIDKVEVGNIIEIKNGYCRFKRGKQNLAIGKNGKLLIKKSKNDDFIILRLGLSKEEQEIKKEQKRIRLIEFKKHKENALKKTEYLTPKEKEEARKAKEDKEKKEKFLKDLHDSV